MPLLLFGNYDLPSPLESPPDYMINGIMVTAEDPPIPIRAHTHVYVK